MLSRPCVFILLFLNIASVSSGQNCLPSGIQFLTQGAIDSFSINYPGCTVIEGEVCVGGCQWPVQPSDITSLSGLSQLTSIKGDILILLNPRLKSLDGLQNLAVIENNILIRSNDSLISIDAIGQVNAIRGTLALQNNPSVVNIPEFELLDTCGGIEIYGMDALTSINSFSNLKYLGNYHILNNNYILSINDLNNLEYLGGFHIEMNYNLLDLPDFPLITVVNGDFIIRDNWELNKFTGYESIERVTGNFELATAGPEIRGGSESRIINGFHNLTFVGGNLSIPYLDQLDTLDALTMVDSIGGSLDINLEFAVHNFPVPNRFNYIGGDIGLEGLDYLQDLQCLSSLDSIRGDLYMRYCPNVVTVSGIEHISKIGGDLSLSLEGLNTLSHLSNLNSIGGSLNISDSEVLPDLMPLINLSSMGGSLVVANCDMLQDLSGLESLTSMDGQLWIFGNKNLLTLEGIHNIDPQSIRSTGNAAINIINNARLSICDLQNICVALHIYRKPYWIYGNATGCETIHQIDCGDLGFSGIVFFDVNQNKIQDTLEVGIPGIDILIDPNEGITLTNEDGYYLALAEEDSIYTLTIDLGNDWILTTDSLSYTQVFNDGLPANENNDFGIYPTVTDHDLSVNLTSEFTRCNQIVMFYLRYANEGTFPESGRIILQYDSSAIYINSSETLDTHDVVKHELIWEVDTLFPYHHGDILIRFRMPDENMTGQPMNFTVTTLVDSSGVEIPEDIYTYTPVVSCAYDPNDKLVMPPGIEEENYTLKDDVINYTVRFENTGNAEAIHITIIDMLDPSFDMSTFKVVNSSYPVFANLYGHKVEFFFENIWLRKNEKGFVTYEIKPLIGIPDHTPVENNADIIFDFNQPIGTNTTFNTLVYEICEDVSFSIDTVICIGENFLGYTETGIYFDTIQIGSICDSFSRITLVVYEIELFQIDTVICEGESFQGYDSSGVFLYDSLNAVTGCVDHVELTLEVVPIGTSPCITGTDNILDYPIRIYPNPVHNELFVETSGSIGSISLFTMQGIKVDIQHDHIPYSKAIIYLPEDLPAGFYILEIKQGDNSYYEKLIRGGNN